MAISSELSSNMTHLGSKVAISPEASLDFAHVGAKMAISPEASLDFALVWRAKWPFRLRRRPKLALPGGRGGILAKSVKFRLAAP